MSLSRGLTGAIVALLLLLLTGCEAGGGGGGGGGGTTPYVLPDPTSDRTEAVPDRRSTPTAAFPSELVGVWLGGGPNGSGWLEFAGDGSFRTGSYQGTAVLDGSTLTLLIDGGSTLELAWSLSGGILYLDGSPYLRDDGRSGGSISLTGNWININGYTSIRFGSDGSFQLDDQANNEVTIGSYQLDGNQLTLTSTTKRPSSYLIEVGDFLTFYSTDGSTVIGEYTRAG